MKGARAGRKRCDAISPGVIDAVCAVPVLQRSVKGCNACVLPAKVSQSGLVRLVGGCWKSTEYGYDPKGRLRRQRRYLSQVPVRGFRRAQTCSRMSDGPPLRPVIGQTSGKEGAGQPEREDGTRLGGTSGLVPRLRAHHHAVCPAGGKVTNSGSGQRRTAPPGCHEVQWALSYLPEQAIPALRWPEVNRASLLSKCKGRVGVVEWRTSRQGLGVCKMQQRPAGTQKTRMREGRGGVG